MRNVIIHKLLSADRSKGVEDRKELVDLAKGYREQCENSSGINDKELRSIVFSVMKYKALNTNYQKVNSNYISWIRKRGLTCTEEQEKLLYQLDEVFFNQVLEKVEDDKTIPNKDKSGISLSKLYEIRSRFLESQGLKWHSNYRHDLLAAKLKSLGFQKIRTNKVNLWLIKVSNDYLDKIRPSVVINEIKEKTKINVMENQQNNNDKPANTEPTSSKEDVIIEEKTIKVKVKHHPDEDRYPGYKSLEYREALLGMMMTYPASPDVNFVFDKVATHEFVKTLKPGDVIGLGIDRVHIKSTNIGNDQELVIGMSFMDKCLHSFSLQEIDKAVKMSFAQILYRDDKPYGIDEEQELKLKIIKGKQSSV